MIISVLSAILFLLGIVLLCNCTPDQVTDDLMQLLAPPKTLYTTVIRAQKKPHSHRLLAVLQQTKHAMTATGKAGQFSVICTLSLGLLVLGGVSAVLLDNLFLVPVLSVLLSMLPFFYVKRTIQDYERHIEEEMETALSIVTTAYVAERDLIKAVTDKLAYIKPPLQAVFGSFVGETLGVNADVKLALLHMKSKVDNEIFAEWVDTLITCQEDRKLCDTLLPVVSKLTEVRVVNNELKTILYEPKKEYFAMVLMVVCNVPLLYLLNQDWYAALMFTTAGKLVLAICGATILITAVLMSRYTKPIRYRR